MVLIFRLFAALCLGGSAALAAEGDGLDRINAEAQAAHAKRNLGDSTPLYKKLLEMNPPLAPSAAQQKLVEKFVPRLHLVANEFFPLKDIVAILHPDKPVIGYHLFWEDDLGFPSDNDPCDHEVVWVEFDPATEKAVRISTYWHGRIVSTAEAVADANAHGGRPWIGVEWGFHGSIAWRAIGQVAAVDEILHGHWERAHAGAKPPLDPLARGWPTRYPGDYAAFTKFSVPYDARPMLRERELVYVSRWANATINRYCLRYNFAAKTEWPWLGK